MEVEDAGEERSRWAEIAYEAIAPVYDDFTAHHDYELWLGNLLPELEAHGLRGSRLLDVACGTGKSFIPMLERGWEVTACDISPAMVELARGEGRRRGRRSRVADMRELPVVRRVRPRLVPRRRGQLPAQRRGAGAGAAGMRRNLAPERAADVRRQHARVLPHLLRRRGRGRAGRPAADLARPRRAPTHEPGAIHEASFEVEPLEDADAGRSRRELHRQRHFPEAEMLAALERAGLECLDVFGHADDAVPEQPLDEDAHYKAIYIARASVGVRREGLGSLCSLDFSPVSHQLSLTG